MDNHLILTQDEVKNVFGFKACVCSISTYTITTDCNQERAVWKKITLK